MTTVKEAKTKAYNAAADAFLRCMRELVGEAGIAQLADGETDEHAIVVSVGNGRAFTAHVTIEFGPLSTGPELDDF
jgi:hypothetical protein